MSEFVLPSWINKELAGVNGHIRRICTSRVDSMQKMMDCVLESKGKQLRPILTILCSRLTGKKPDVQELAAVIEICHTASLIHDDIIDEGEMRRGAPSIQKRFGKEMAVYAGDFMIFSAIGRTRLVNKLWYREVFDKLEAMCDGEVKQYDNRYNTELKETQYISYIKGKTSSLFEIACLSGIKAARAPHFQVSAIKKFSESFGILFQLRDDYFDFLSSEEEYKKTVASDFRNGYYTMPVICAFNNEKTSDRMKEIARDRTGRSNSGWDEILSLIREADGFSYTRNSIRDHARCAIDALKAFPESESKKILENLIAYLLSTADINETE